MKLCNGPLRDIVNAYGYRRSLSIIYYFWFLCCKFKVISSAPEETPRFFTAFSEHRPHPSKQPRIGPAGPIADAIETLPHNHVHEATFPSLKDSNLLFPAVHITYFCTGYRGPSRIPTQYVTPSKHTGYDVNSRIPSAEQNCMRGPQLRVRGEKFSSLPPLIDIVDANSCLQRAR